MKDKFMPTTGHAGTAALGGPVERNSTGSASLLTRAVALLVSCLREIFDESAYDRFLHRSRVPSSREAYATFRREHESAKARRPRCC
jgi:hypothetical protein